MNRKSRTRRLAAEQSAETNPSTGVERGLLGTVRHNRLLFAGLLTAVIVLFVLAIFTPRFETNDDVGMNSVAAGRMIVDRPDEHIVYSNVLVGLALKQLYLAAPNVPWYGGYLFVTAALSLAAVAFACWKRDTSPAEICLTAVFLCLVGTPFLIVLQFTRVAFLATLAGLVLLAAVVRDSRPARQAFWAIPFLVAGALIRIDSFLVAPIVLSPLVAWMVWRSRSQVSARRRRRSGRGGRRRLRFGSVQ